MLSLGPPLPGCNLGGPQSSPLPPVGSPPAPGGTVPGLPPVPDPRALQCVKWRPGRVVIGTAIPGNAGQGAPAPTVSAAKAHTGRKSLRVTAATDAYNQIYLNLLAERAYVLSAWVSRDGVDTPSLRSTAALPQSERLGISVAFLDAAGGALGEPVLFEPDGPVIEGWQQINGLLTRELPPVGTASIAISLHNGKQARLTDAGSLIDEVKPAYFDDVRVFPETGGVETYVYDPADYRLRASLDKNNYATLFGYDAEGTLFLVRKETVRGLQTVRETRLNLGGHAPPAVTH
jgi:hypothetical protein